MNGLHARVELDWRFRSCLDSAHLGRRAEHDQAASESADGHADGIPDHALQRAAPAHRAGGDVQFGGVAEKPLAIQRR